MTLSNRQKGQLGKEAKQLAIDARQIFQLPPTSPIENIYSVLETQGAIILRFPSEEDRLSGFSLKIAQYMCIYVNGNHSLGRQHYSIAHEICHALFDLTDKPLPPSYIGADNEDNDDPVEYRANRFASYFLMPDEAVAEYKKRNLISKKPRHMTIKDILFFQHFFRVSFHAALKRLLEERVIFFTQFKSWRDLSSPSNATTLQRITLEYGLPVELIVPTKDIYISDNFVKNVILNYQEDRITTEKMEYLLDLMGLPESAILRIGGIEND